jgi:arginase
MNIVSLIPFICGAGASRPGAEQGAVYARAHGLVETLAAAGITAEWAVDPEAHWNGPYGRIAHENLTPRGSPERLETVTWHVQALAENVIAELRRGNRVVTIGGDHSLAAGSVAGAHAALGPDVRLGLIWVDAHPDIHTFQSSVSKALHGMPMATLTGLDQTLSLPENNGPIIQPEDIIFAGLRDIDEGEFENAKKLGITLLAMDTLRAQGIAQTLQEAVMSLAARCDHIILSIDLDAFSTNVAPAVGSPVPDGFMPDEILPILAGITRSHSVPLIDIVEFNPTLPGAEKTYQLVIDILSGLLPRDAIKDVSV